MGLKLFSLVLLVIGSAIGQDNFRVCIPETDRQLCNNLDREGQAQCLQVESRVDCAIRLARNAVDFGAFSEEETLLLGQQQPNDHRVIATIRDVSRVGDPYAFEAVAVVPNDFTGGLAALRDGRYCHPGFDISDQRWSPRVLRAFEQAVAQTDRCPNAVTDRRSAEDLEVETLSTFFQSACRPGAWSANNTVDADLKRRFPNLCTLCGNNNTCINYSLDMGVSVVGVNNNNRHIQALECLRVNGNRTVAYVAWQHVKEFFTLRNPADMSSFALLCDDGSTRQFSTELLASPTAPCAFVRQPWSTIVASTARAQSVLSSMREWWPGGVNPGNAWQSNLFNGIVGGANARVVFEETLPSPANYTATIRNIPSIDSTASCIPHRRWCTLSSDEQTKCNWVRTAAYSLGIQPAISCQQRASIFECFRDLTTDNVDFVASKSNYGYLARQHFSLSPVKMVQNSRSAPHSRVAAFVKANGDITRFENLKGRRACFPEYGGIAYVAFIRAAHERGVISRSECDYARAGAEFFDSACAPGALDASHAISDSSFNASSLCSVCRTGYDNSTSTATCAWDHSNIFFGNNGSLACLNDPNNDVAILQIQNISGK